MLHLPSARHFTVGVKRLVKLSATRHFLPAPEPHGGVKMSDQEITCAECGAKFEFSEKEQQYYRERNLSQPKRCKPCRDARRASFGGGDMSAAPARQRFEITCDKCGKHDSVPFKPQEGRAVLCSACFSASRTNKRFEV
jgi:CxxC-x17-CxxC domain-containing protein